MAELRPQAIVNLDLARGLHPPAPRADGRELHLVYWWGDTPLGSEELNARSLPPRPLAERIAARIAGPVGERLLGAGFEGADPGTGLPEPDTVADLAALLALERPLEALAAYDPPPAPRLTVTLAICTRGRPDQLARCLESVGRAARRPDELIVVDNGPSADTRAAVEAFAGARYLPEPRAGLSIARNRAVEAATSDLIAFVDDDTEVTAGWLDRLAVPFADPGVVAVTGLVLPAALDTPSQLRFEKVLGGFNRGYQPLVYDRGFFDRMRPHAVPVWRIGAGANMALRLDAVRGAGLFDERLGAGASGCSEDSELWYRLLAAGWTCRYEPSSVVLHHHRGDEAGLRHQAEEYIRGHVSALFVQYARHGDVGNLRRVAFLGPWLVTRALLEGQRRAFARARLAPPVPRRPALRELRGYARGLAYGSVVFADRQTGGKAPLIPFLRRNPFPHRFTEGFFYMEKMRAIHRVAPDIAPAKVLEVGGGRSGLARLLYPSAHVTTVDLDPTYADAPVNQQPGVTFVVGDATRLPFPDASFDVVTLFDVLEHIEDDRAAAAEALRVVRPGGYVLASSPNRRWRSPYHRVMAPICPTDEDMIERWGHVRRGYSLPEFEAVFGLPAEGRAEFINRLTAVGHDLGFSHLPGRARRVLATLVAPLTWAGFLLQPRHAPGTETAARWRRPAA